MDVPVGLFLQKEDTTFEIGKALQMSEGSDVTIVATGHMVWQSLEAARALAKEGISCDVLDIHTIKPLDDKAIIQSVAKTKCVVSAEEHQRNGGLGDSVAQLLARYMPVPMEYVAVNDSFGESGTPMQLLDKYGLGIKDVVAAIRDVIRRK